MITSIPREISDPGLITKHFQYTTPPLFTTIYLFFCMLYLHSPLALSINCPFQ